MRKSTEYLYIAVLVLLGILSFGLGRLSVAEQPSVPVSLCTENLAQVGLVVAQTSSSTISASHSGNYVASKNGSVYHLPWCSGAQRILEENKIWFSTQEEAQAAGYRPAGNCKGL